MVPPATRAVGQSGHVADHNDLAVELTALKTPTTVLDVDRHFAGNIQSAVNEAESSGGDAALVQLGPGYELSAEVVINRGITLAGAGQRATLIQPATGYSGWCITVSDAERAGQWQADDTTYDPAIDKSGPVLRNLHISGLDRVNAHNGIRVLRADDLIIEDVTLGFLRGTALLLGGGTSVGSVRESYLNRVRVMHCGDGPSVPAWIIENNSTGTGDGTNQIRAHQCALVYNRGGLHIRNHHATETNRRVVFTDTMVHGAVHATAGNLVDHDLITIEGGVSDVEFKGLMCNSSGVAPLAIIRTKASATSGRSPQGLHLSAVNASNIVGDVLAVDALSDLSMTGRFATGSIDGAVLRVAASGSGLVCYDVRAVGATAFASAPAAKFIVPSALQTNGRVTWGGQTITPATS